ncbi:Mucin-19 [Fukomys damarensis]|uniref:Mucin-19 n=1 Tax=Fukomys damarensis TaxID=885580 RepID=A0A091CJE3_FUKDA|nr:Mucin-19 [Fukomys damarensis]
MALEIGSANGSEISSSESPGGDTSVRHEHEFVAGNSGNLESSALAPGEQGTVISKNGWNGVNGRISAGAGYKDFEFDAGRPGTLDLKIGGKKPGVKLNLGLSISNEFGDSELREYGMKGARDLVLTGSSSEINGVGCSGGVSEDSGVNLGLFGHQGFGIFGSRGSGKHGSGSPGAASLSLGSDVGSSGGNSWSSGSGRGGGRKGSTGLSASGLSKFDETGISGSGEASTWDRGTYRAFNGHIFSFQSSCAYIFCRHCVESGGDFSIEIKRNNNSEIERIRVLIDNNDISIVGDTILVNEERVQIPYNNKLIHIKKFGQYNVLNSRRGILSLVWDKNNKLSLTLHKRYETCGLCGNFNSTPGQDIDEHIVKSKIPGDCPSAVSKSYEICEDGVQYCNNIIGTYFEKCEKVATSLSGYKTICINEYCQSGDKSSMCDTFSELSRLCASDGPGVFESWRDDSNVACEKPTCPEKHIYKECGLSNPATCSNVAPFQDSECVSGCSCPEGLCGSYNNKAEDDFMSSQNILETTSQAFANSWEMMPCPKGTPASCISIEKENFAENSCGILLDSSGPFASCHQIVNPKFYHEECKKYTCSCENSQDCLCTILGNYVKACAEKETSLVGWRTGLCEQSCPSGLVFKYNVKACNSSCRSLSERDRSCDVQDVPVDGCTCPVGMYQNSEGNCVQKSQCDCYINDEVVRPGKLMQIDDNKWEYDQGSVTSVGCNECTCIKGSWNCTQNECQTTCHIYGDGHVRTFDGQSYSFDGLCQYSFLEDQNIVLQDGKVTTVKTAESEACELSENAYSIHTVGLYLILKLQNGIILIWDKYTKISVVLDPKWHGKVCGLCGNNNGDLKDDFTTRYASIAAGALEFGNSWKTSQECSDTVTQSFPCDSNPYCKDWAVRKCEILRDNTFRDCHSKVDPSTYYNACIEEACACDMEGKYLGFCTVVAMYAETCNAAGVCVPWRKPNLCRK